jgi:hypothetical protein
MRKLVPKYAYMKITAVSKVVKNTQTEAQTLRTYKKQNRIPVLKQTGIKYTALPHSHNANIWQQTGTNIEQFVEQKLQQ